MELGALARALISRDGDTRKMGWLFLVSVFGAIVSVVFVLQRLTLITETWKKSRREAAILAKKQEEVLRKKEAESKQKASTIELDPFEIELKGARGHVELNLVLICDSEDVKHHIETHAVKVRNAVVSSVISIDGKEILLPSGKRRLKQQVMEDLNAYLAKSLHGKGRVQEIYFSKLLVDQD
jgi:flagellar basal body-associated protein FliL